MQVFWHELRQRRRGLVLWMVSIVLFMVTSMVKYDAFSKTTEASEQLLKTFPPTMQAVFGMSGLNLVTLTGYIGILYVYLLLMGGIFAGSLGASVLGQEEQGKTAEFLYPKPVSRRAVFTWKYFAASVLVVIFALGSYVSIVLAATKYHPTATDQRVFMLYGLALLLTMFVCLAVGAYFAAERRTAVRAGALTALVVVASYFAWSLSGMLHAFAFLKRVTPFAWFNAPGIIASGGLNLAYVAVSVVLTAGLMSLALRRFLSRDI